MNDIAGGVLGARLFTEVARPGASSGKTRVAVDSARLVRAIGEANARNGGGNAIKGGKPAGGLEIRGASSGTTVEVRELVSGTTSADVKVRLCFACGYAVENANGAADFRRSSSSMVRF